MEQRTCTAAYESNHACNQLSMPRLALVNKKIQHLYGPLSALNDIDTKLWTTFIRDAPNGSIVLWFQTAPEVPRKVCGGALYNDDVHFI